MPDTHTGPLRVAVIGTGWGARVQVPGFLKMDGIAVVALCGRQAQKTRKTADEFGVPGAYTDYVQMLADLQPDLVSITAPPHLHHAMALAALDAGAHVLCEKPLALNVEEARAMLDAARRADRVHAIDYEFRYLPARHYQRDLVAQGYVGEPVLLEGTYLVPWRWERDRAWSWWADAARGGGMLGAIGSHYIDAFRWLSGREVRAVTAVLHTPPPYARRPDPETGAPRAVTSDENAHLVLELDGGLQGVITLSAVAAGDTNRLAIHGTEGALVVQDHVTLWGRRRDDESLQRIPVPASYEPPAWNNGDNVLLGPFVALAERLAGRICGPAADAPPDFADGLAAQRVLDAAYRSAAQGCRVEIAPGQA